MTARALAAVAIPALGAAACAQILGVDDYAQARSDGGSAVGVTPDAAAAPAAAAACGGFRFAGEACGGCMESCCEVLDGCRADAACAGWLECLGACEPEEGACKHACYQQAGTTNAAMGAVAACQLRGCTAECGVGWDVALAPGCEDCTRARCAPQTLACADDPECVGLMECMVASGCAVSRDPGCTFACCDRHRIYENDRIMNLLFCMDQSCQAECGYGTHFECAGGYAWTESMGPEEPVTVRVFEAPAPDLPPGALLSGVPVTVCQLNDPWCTRPVDDGVTDERGLVDLELTAFGSQVFFRANVADGNDRLTVMSYPGRPLQRASYYPLNIFVLWRNYSRLQDPSGPEDACGRRWESGRGLLYVLGRDCTGHIADGLVFSLDGGVSPSSYQERVAAPAPTCGELEEGAGAYFRNLEPGWHTVTARRHEQAVAEERVYVQAGTMTMYQFLFPRTR